MPSTSASFTIDSWDGEAYDDRDGVKLSRAHLVKTWSGGIEGRSVAELLMIEASDGSMAYAGLERVESTIDGRAGAFVLQHAATNDRGTATLSMTVVPDSGTGELRGLRGSMTIEGDQEGGHTVTLDHDLPA